LGYLDLDRLRGLGARHNLRRGCGLTAGVLELRHVERRAGVGRRLDRLDDRLVGEPRGDGFVCGVPGFGVHDGLPVGDGAARLVGVDRWRCCLRTAAPVGGLLQFVGVADGEIPRVVNHHRAVLVHHDPSPPIAMTLAIEAAKPSTTVVIRGV
jgi:hypothetical protein